MDIRNIHLVYFSATFTTRKILREIARVMGGNVIEHDITCGRPSAKVMVDGEHDVLVAGAPVYAGRVPRQAAEALRAFSGNGGPAVIACIYGNRDYDDALAELQDIVDRQGFKTVAAGAFIARHCIFNDVAADRPDTDDMRKIDNFATECARLLASTPDVSALPEPTVKGNRPYKESKALPLFPSADAELCDGCQTCARQCPAGAIPEESPCQTDGDKCISCGRCTVICPRHARAFRGMPYEQIVDKFVKANAVRREPETFFPAPVNGPTA